MKFNQVLAATVVATTTALTQAAPVWQDFSITGLYGENYESIDANGIHSDVEQSTITAEYAAKLTYGDFFAFADRTNNDIDGNHRHND